MNLRSSGIWAWMIYLVLSIACSGTINRYHPSERLPQKIFIDDEFKQIKNTEDLSNQTQIYTEIWTREGEEKTGKLIQITESDLVLSEGYYYRSVNDTLSRIESRKVIPRTDILILKVW